MRIINNQIINMSTPRCEDCGCITQSGTCSNCQEELYIVQNQCEYVEQSLSEEFKNKVKEQKALLESRK